MLLNFFTLTNLYMHVCESIGLSITLASFPVLLTSIYVCPRPLLCPCPYDHVNIRAHVHVHMTTSISVLMSISMSVQDPTREGKRNAGAGRNSGQVTLMQMLGGVGKQPGKFLSYVPINNMPIS